MRKFRYIRNSRYRDACRALPCQICGQTEGVTWAHSNQAKHGKGLQIKASDEFVAALCQACHMSIDQGLGSDRRARWDEAHARTVEAARELGVWPEGGA